MSKKKDEDRLDRKTYEKELAAQVRLRSDQNQQPGNR
jgi:hypothetical protein